MPDGVNLLGRAVRPPSVRHFERLEERLLLAAQPVVAVQGGDVPIGGEATVTVTFDNIPDASGGSEIGFSPYIDLILPQNGADGGSTSPQDGASFVSASYQGAAVAATVIEFDANGQAVHPFARDAAGNLRVVQASDYGAAAGDQLAVLRLPFGSFVPDQPAATITVTLAVSPLADLNTPLPVTAVGGFAFGRDALNNPTDDAPVLGVPATGSITPTLLTLDKSFSGPEGETATGPSFPRTYTINFDLATGQTVTNASLLDMLPNGIVVLGTPVLSGLPGTATYDPLTHTVAASFDGTVTGVAGTEATLTIRFYVAETLVPGEPGTPVLGVADGASRTLLNTVTGQADWTPLDPRDDPQTVTDTAQVEFIAKSIAVQKTQTVVVDVGAPGLGPGDTIEYVVEGQVSDYYRFNNLVLNDLMSDGQVYLDGTARLDVLEGGSTAGSGSFLPANFSVVRDGTTGQTAFVFNVSGQLVSGLVDGQLDGGEATGNGPTTFRIAYRALVERFFVDGGGAVGQGDSLSNTTAIAADVVDDNGLVTGSNGDDSASTGRIQTGGVTKEVYAVNGTLVAPGQTIAIGAGDEVTFRLSYALPQTLTSELRLRDFLPLPIFDVAGLSLTLLDVVSADAPAVNVVKWGPDAGGFDALLTTIPELTFDTAANSLTITFRDLNPAVPTATVADILFTLAVVDQSFGDGLLLTNQVQATEVDNQGLETSSTAIRQLLLTEPELQITKGVIATDSAVGDFTPDAVGPVPFSAPGSAGVRFTGTIDSNALAAQSINSDIGNLDAGDRVSFAIVVENLGSGVNGAFDVLIRDTLQPGYAIPTAGLNLRVTDGAGNALAFTGDLFAGGITLTDPGGPLGALAAFAATGGANIVIITYDLQITQDAEPEDAIVNTSAIGRFAAIEGGVDRVPNNPLPVEDDATAVIADPGFLKRAITTSLTETGSTAGNDALFDLTIGETVTFELVITLREGRIRNLLLDDILPSATARLDFVSASVFAIGDNIRVRNLDGSAGAGIGNPVITSTTNSVRFDFADDILNVADNQVTAADRITVRIVAIAADAPGNQPGVVAVNRGDLSFSIDTGTRTLSDTARVEIVGPAFDLTKQAGSDTAAGGEIVTYTVELTPTASDFAGPAFDLAFEDALLPGQISLVAGSLTLVTAPAGGATLTEVGGGIRVAADVLLPGETIRFTYRGLLAPTVVAGTTLPNTVDLQYDSYPGTPPLGVQRVFTDAATDSVLVPGPGIAKTVVEADTSLPETGSGAFDPTLVDLAIGEIVTYRITVFFPEAVSTGVTVRDLLPAGVGAEGLFQFLSAAIVTTGANLSGPGLAATPVADDSNADGILDRVTFSLGDITNTPDQITDAADAIVFTVTARVLDAPVNAAGQQPNNVAIVIFGGQTSTASVRVDIVEPDLGIDKTASETTADAGDRITFQIAAPFADPDAGPVYNVVLTDLVPLGLSIDLATLAFVGGTPTLATLGYDAATRTITARLPTYVPGDPNFAITYQAAVDDSVRVGDVLTNAAAVVFDSHPDAPGDQFQRAYGPVQDATDITIDFGGAIAKTVVDTSLPETTGDPAQPEVAIGETITYSIVLTLGEGTQRVLLQDTLPDGLEFLAGQVVSIDASIGNALLGVGDAALVTGQSISFDFGTDVVNAGNSITGDGQIVVQVTARIRDVSGNVAGAVLTNDARFTSDTGTINDTAPVEIVEAKLLLDKTVPPGFLAPGEVTTYTLVLSHSGASTAAAYDIMLTDLLADPFLDLVAGSVTTTLGSVTLGNTAGDTTLSVNVPLLLLGQTVTITYQARVADNAPGGITLSNSATAAFDSAPGPGGRPDDVTDGTVTPGAPGLAKIIVATGDPNTGDGQGDPAIPDLAIGETLTYRLTITFSQGTTADVVLADLLPSSLALLGARVVSIGSGLTVGAQDITIAGQNFSVAFGTVVNASGATIGAEEQITVEIDARVLDASGLVNGSPVVNAASLGFTIDGRDGTLTATAPAEIVLPELEIAKQVDRPGGDAGDVFTYTVTIDHAAGSTAAAYNLTISDTLDPALILIDASSSVGSVATAGNTVTLTLDQLLLTDAPILLTYRARFADSIEPGQVVPNVVALGYTTAPEDGRALTDAAAASVRGEFAVALAKDIVATSLPETGNAFFDPARPDVAAGETVTYRITATLSEGTQRLLITDALPPGLVAEAARLVAIGAGVTAGAPQISLSAGSVAFDFGTVVNRGDNLGGDTVVVEITARLAPGVAAGTALANNAAATIASPTNPDAPGGTQGATASAAIDAVAAALVLDKQVAQTTVGLGETITYTLVLSQTPGSSAPAYNVVLDDALADPSLQLLTGSVVTSAGTVVLGNAPGDRAIRVTLPVLLPGETLSVSFNVRAIGFPAPDGIAPNTASFTSVAAPGVLPAGFSVVTGGSDTAAVRIVTPTSQVAGGDLLGDFDDAFRRLRQNGFTLPGILTGTAQPGATVSLQLYDETGAPLGAGSVTADVGGNWVARAQTEGYIPRFDVAAFDATRYAVGRLPDQAPLPEREPLPVPASAPFTVLAASAPAAYDLRGIAQDAVQVTFGGALQPGGVFTGAAASAANIGALPTAAATARDLAQLTAPLGLAWNRFALDFAGAQVAASTTGR